VGKVAIIAVFALGAISVGTYRLTGNAAIIGISAMVLVTLAVLGLILYIVIVRPELAVLEGTELVLYKQITLGAKDMLPPAENVSSIAGPVALATKADEKPEAGKE